MSRLVKSALWIVLAACGGWVLAQERAQPESTRDGRPNLNAKTENASDLLDNVGAGLLRIKHDAKAEDADDELGRFLKSRGFTAIALDRLKSGHLAVVVTASGARLRLILDTGAPGTCIDPERTKAMNLTWIKSTDVGPAERDPRFDTFQSCELGRLDFGAFKTGRVRACVLRVASINQWLALCGEPPIDGVLGGDVLAAHSARIDYPGLRLYLR